jgi:hypothetical protein
VRPGALAWILEAQFLAQIAVAKRSVIFGNVTGPDPRSLGENECSAYELGLSAAHAKTGSRSRPTSSLTPAQ